MISAYREIVKGCRFALIVGDTVYTYRSYTYQRKIYIKYMIDDREIHLGRFHEDVGMRFNKKFGRKIRDSSDNYAKALWRYARVVMDGGTIADIHFKVLDTEGLSVYQKIQQDAKDDKDYFYRIGL